MLKPFPEFAEKLHAIQSLTRQKRQIHNYSHILQLHSFCTRGCTSTEAIVAVGGGNTASVSLNFVELEKDRGYGVRVTVPKPLAVSSLLVTSPSAIAPTRLYAAGNLAVVQLKQSIADKIRSSDLVKIDLRVWPEIVRTDQELELIVTTDAAIQISIIDISGRYVSGFVRWKPTCSGTYTVAVEFVNQCCSVSNVLFACGRFNTTNPRHVVCRGSVSGLTLSWRYYNHTECEDHSGFKFCRNRFKSVSASSSSLRRIR